MKHITYSHEHMFIDLSKGKNNPDCLLNVYEDALEELKELHELGVDRIVDCSNIGMGRDVGIVKKLEAESGIEILLSTGFYKDPFLPKEVINNSCSVLASMMIDEIENGVEGKKISFIGEIGTSKDMMTESEYKVFEAACIAHKKTGIPIITHTTLGTYALEQLAFFKEREVDLSRVIISHTALANNSSLILKLLASGVNIAFDTIGKSAYASDEKRAEFIIECVDRGYMNQLFMSMDLTRKSHTKKYGGIGYAYLIDVFVPLLKAKGLSEAVIETIMCKNIERLL